MASRPRHQHLLAFGRRRDLAPADPRRPDNAWRPDRRNRASCGLRGRDRARLGPRRLSLARQDRALAFRLGRGRRKPRRGRSLSHARLPRALFGGGAASACSLFRSAGRLARADRPRLDVDFGRDDRRARLRRAAGLFGARAARPHSRGGQCAQRRRDGRRRPLGRGFASRRRPNLDALWRRRALCRRFGFMDQQGRRRKSGARLAIDPLSLSLRLGGQGNRKFRSRRSQSDRRAQSCQLPRRGACALDHAARADLRHRPDHRRGLVGEALPEIRECRAARSDEALRDARARQRRQERGAAGDLSGRAPHSDRQFDEGL